MSKASFDAGVRITEARMTRKFKARIAELEAELAKRQWISVEDRLPEEDTYRVLIINDGVATTGFHVGLEWYYVTACGVFHSSGLATNVTYWKPITLPESEVE